MAIQQLQDEDLDKLEDDIRMLKNKYDQFFATIAKVPPMQARRNVEHMIFELGKQKMRDNARRFRYQTLLSKYNMFRELWARKTREKEEGPLDFRKRKQAFEAPLPDPPAPPPRPAVAPAVTSPQSDPYVKVTSQTAADSVRRLYEDIQREHSVLGKTSNVTFEQLSAMIEKQSEVVRTRYNVNTVAFRIETVDGKVKLKAKPIQE